MRTPEGSTTSSRSTSTAAVISTKVSGEILGGDFATVVAGRRTRARVVDGGEVDFDESCHRHHLRLWALRPVLAANWRAVSPLSFSRVTRSAHTSRADRRFARIAPKNYASEHPASGTRFAERIRSVHVIAKAADRRASYEWQYSLDGGKTWVDVPNTLQAKTTITGLPAATVVLFRYRPTTKAGMGDWSAPASILVK